MKQKLLAARAAASSTIMPGIAGMTAIFIVR